MTALTILLAAAALAYGLAQRLRLPGVPFLVLVGVGLSATGLLADERMRQDVMLLGLTFLVFVAGTELHPRRIGGQGRLAVQVGLAQFFLLGGIGFFASQALGFELVPALYMALALAASSTLVVLRILRQRQQFFEPFGRLVVGVLLVQDFLVIFLIAVLARVGDGALGVVEGLAATTGLILLAWAVARWVTPLLERRLELDEETLLLCTLTVLFSFAGIAYWSNVPLVVGAFLGGMALSPFPLNGLIRGQLSSLADFFLAVFFVALGAGVSLPTAEELTRTAVLALLVIVLTPPLVTVLAGQAGMSARSSIESGLLLAQCSELSLVVGLIGLERGHIEPGAMAVVTLVTIVTMMLTPLVATDRVTWRLMNWHPLTGRVRLPDRPSDHILLLGCGPNAQQILDRLLALNLRTIVVDDDLNTVNRLRESGVEAYRGDGADYLLLRSVGARRARMIISNMRRVQDNERLIRFARRVPVVVRVFDTADAERIRKLGGTPVLYSAAGAEDFLRWFESEFQAHNRPAGITRGEAG